MLVTVSLFSEKWGTKGKTLIDQAVSSGIDSRIFLVEYIQIEISVWKSSILIFMSIFIDIVVYVIDSVILLDLNVPNVCADTTFIGAITEFLIF